MNLASLEPLFYSLIFLVLSYTLVTLIRFIFFSDNDQYYFDDGSESDTDFSDDFFDSSNESSSNNNNKSIKEIIYDYISRL